MQENKLRVFTAFSGYDSQCMALERLGIPYDLVGWSEIDKYAIMAHDAVFPQWKDRNYGDISKIDWESVPDFDFLTYSFPCTDISNAGLQKGFKEGSGTRSGLLWECAKAIKAKHPKWLLMENVKALASKKFMPDFEKWLNFLTGEGYHTTWDILNAKNFGVPQNRERVFAVSELRFQFPHTIPLDKCMADILEPEETVDKKYYLDAEKLSKFVFDEKFAERYENDIRQGDTCR